MLLAHEYDSYGVQRKPLRVSWPKEKQRSTYYLSLPYRYSVPLLVTSAVLHWLVSQSFFFVAIIPFDIREKSEANYRAFSCGYSPMAIILAISVGGLMILAILCLGMRRFESDIPIAGSCSAAISAACHPLAGKGHELRAVQWGEIQTPSEHDTISTQATKQASSRTKSTLQLSCFETEESSINRPIVSRPVSSLHSIYLDAGEGLSTNQEQLGGSCIHLLDPVEQGSYGAAEGHGHCSFTSDEVIAPRPERLYTWISCCLYVYTVINKWAPRQTYTDRSLSKLSIGLLISIRSVLLLRNCTRQWHTVGGTRTLASFQTHLMTLPQKVIIESLNFRFNRSRVQMWWGQ